MEPTLGSVYAFTTQEINLKATTPIRLIRIRRSSNKIDLPMTPSLGIKKNVYCRCI